VYQISLELPEFVEDITKKHIGIFLGHTVHAAIGLYTVFSIHGVL